MLIGVLWCLIAIWQIANCPDN